MQSLRIIVFGLLLLLKVDSCTPLLHPGIRSNWTKPFQNRNKLVERRLQHFDESVASGSSQPGTIGRFINSIKNPSFEFGDKKRSPSFAKNFCPVFIVVSLVSTPLWAAAASTASPLVLAAIGKPATLGGKNLLAAALLLGGLAALPLSRMGVRALARALVISASRCAVQVFLLGSVVVQRMMGTSQPLYVVTWIIGVGLIAGKEAFSRIQYTYPRMNRHVYLSVLTGGLTVLALTLGLNILGTMEPWFQPRTWIPVAGMLFGNTLSATALGASTFTKQFVNNQDQVELRLARGATSHESVLPLIQDTLLTALTPTINGLAVTGIVHIPGMMTGQILAGQAPPQAAAYQIMINFLIATTACTTVLLLVNSAIGALVDSRNHRLRPEMLTSKDDMDSKGSNLLATIRRILSKPTVAENSLTSETKSIPQPVEVSPTPLSSRNSSENAVVLEVKDLNVARANAQVSLRARCGDIVGITGRSGVGKSQILRTLAGLQESNSDCLLLHGTPLRQLFLPEFRTKVCLVPQSRPTLESTPRKFHEEISRFDCQRHAAANREQTPQQIAKQWGLEEKVFDQPWSTLSGGEAQRISLAIALSLEPDVLLLDESMSALDEVTCKLVEQTLVESRLPIVAVTHSKEQLARFCTHQLTLS